MCTEQQLFEYKNTKAGIVSGNKEMQISVNCILILYLNDKFVTVHN